jgi:hypothetical protein
MSDWIEEEFGEVDLGDKRCDARLRLMIERKMDQPQASISASCHGPNEVIAASRFLNNDLVTPEKILAPHRDCILERIREAAYPEVLLIQDTTECDFSTHKALTGMGPLGAKEHRGFFAHNQLAVTTERLPLGLWKTQLYARQDEEHGKAAKRKAKLIQDKESMRWLEGYRDACNLATEVPGCQIISISDREGDIYEVFAEYTQRKAQGLAVAEFLIRSNQDRCLKRFEKSAQKPGKIRSQLAQAPALGQIQFHVPKAEQLKKVKGSRLLVTRSARDVVQEVRAISIHLKPPSRQVGETLPVVELTVVEAREINPPAGEKPLVWILLTSLPVKTLAQAEAVLKRYLCRWEIELFHKVLKSGCKLEALQQRYDFSLKPAIIICMIIAWRILYATQLGRTCPELPCEVMFDRNEWEPVVVVLNKGRAALKSPPTLGEMILLIAKLGGYLGRKNDPPPGSKCLWVGMARMADIALGWEASHRPPYDTG